MWRVRRVRGIKNRQSDASHMNTSARLRARHQGGNLGQQGQQLGGPEGDPETSGRTSGGRRFQTEGAGAKACGKGGSTCGGLESRRLVETQSQPDSRGRGSVSPADSRRPCQCPGSRRGQH